MTLENFVIEFASHFDGDEAASISADTVYQELGEWGSLSMMLVIASIHASFGKNISAEEIRGCNSVRDLYMYISSKD